MGTLVFASTRTADLHGEIVVVDPARGGRRLNLSRHPADDRDAALSPDGRRIAFVSDRGGGQAVWTMTAAGRQLRRVTGLHRDPGGKLMRVSGPRWSPDGMRLLYVVSTSSGSSLFLIPSKGGSPRRVAPGGEFAWAPDGRRVAVAESLPGGAGLRVAVYDLRGRVLSRRDGVLIGWSVRGDLATATATRVTVERARGGRTTVPGSLGGAWSPDGSKLAFLGADGIWLLGASGPPRRAVVERGATRLVWRPDGRSLLYHDRQDRAVVLPLEGRPHRLGYGAYAAVWSRDGRLAFGYSSLSVARPGHQPRVLDRGAIGPCPMLFGSLAWFADGRLLVVRGRNGQQQAGLWRSDGSGAPPRRFLGDANDWESAPAWSPDGRRVVYERAETLIHASSCSGPINPRLWIANAGGRGARALTNPGEFQDTGPAWSPDGDRIAFRRASIGGPEGAGVFVVEVANGRTLRTTDSFADTGYSWSPDSRRIVFSRDGEVHVVGVDGNGLERLVVGGPPAWSPAGGLIAYVQRGEVWTVAPDGSGARPLATARDVPRWSPNGRLIAVTNGDSLSLVTPGGTARTVARGKDVRDISWSPDGRWLSYVATAPPDGRSELFRVSAAGGRPTQLTRDLALVGRATWQP